MITHIMVPLDGSPLAESALPFAQHLALISGATIHLVRVTSLPQGLFWSPTTTYLSEDTLADLERSTEQEATCYLEAVRRSLTAQRASVCIHHLSGPAGQRLEQFEQQEQIDVVVMVSHGRSGLSRLAIGSVAEHLLHHGSAPLLLVRSSTTAPTIQQVLIPLDGSQRAEHAVEAVMGLEYLGVQDILLLRTVGFEEEQEEAEQYLDGMCGSLPYCRAHVHGTVMIGTPAQSIIDVAGVSRLIVMVTHGRTAFSRWVLGSVGDQVAREAQAPVLLLREGTLAASRLGHMPPRQAMA